MHPEGTNFCMHFMYKIQSSSLKCENYSILMYYKQYNIFPAHAKTENEKFSFLIAHFSHSHDTKNTGYTNWKWKKKFWLYNIYKYGVQYTEQELSRTFYVLYSVHNNSNFRKFYKLYMVHQQHNKIDKTFKKQLLNFNLFPH